VPSKEELRHYKLKQEIAYELPILSRITQQERDFLSQVGARPPDEQMAYSERRYRVVVAENPEVATASYRKEIGFLELQESGMVHVETGHVSVLAGGKEVAVNLHLKLTAKGIRWIRYLMGSGRFTAKKT